MGSERRWGIETVQAVCAGGPFDGRQVDNLGLSGPLTVGARFGYEHAEGWAMYLVTDDPAPDAGHSDTYIWRTTEARIARFEGFEPMTDEQREEVARMKATS